MCLLQLFMISWEVWCWTPPGLTHTCFHHSVNKPNLCSSETWNCKKGKRKVSFQIIIAWTAVDCGKVNNHYWEAQGFSKCGPWKHTILQHVCHKFTHERSTEIETLETFVAWQNNFILVEYNIKKLELVYLSKFNFPINLFLLYFTQILVHCRWFEKHWFKPQELC